MSAATFARKAVGLVENFITEFDLETFQACAIVGNVGHESNGFASLQEIKPTVAGSRGGYGWPQWTGPRRRAYEAWCEKNNLDPASDKANYGYMVVELRGKYQRAIVALKKEEEIEAAVKTFEKIYEGAGVKHYPSRIAYAEKAMALYQKKHGMTDISSVMALPDGPMSGKENSITKAVQTDLAAMKYFTGMLDGRWGGKTKGELTAFMLDRGVEGEARIDDEVVAAIAKARAEGWTRPIADARKNATAVDLAPHLPEVAAAAKSEKVGFWAGVGVSITTAVTTAYKAVTMFFTDAVGYLQPIKDLAEGVPWYVWVGAGVAGSLVLFYIAQKSGEAKDASTEAFQEGARV